MTVQQIELKYSGIAKLREILREQQNNICPICGKNIVSPVLDHHHKKKLGGTGRIRGVLCLSCNAYIGPIENRASRHLIKQEEIPTVLRNTADYLEAKQTIYLHPKEKPKQKILSKRNFNKMVKKFKEISQNKVPEYPKSRHLTKSIQAYYDKTGMKPEFNK